MPRMAGPLPGSGGPHPGTLQHRLPIQVLEEIVSFLIDEDLQGFEVGWRTILGQDLWDALYEGPGGNVEMWHELFERLGVE